MRRAALALGLALAAGCASTPFVYRPAGPQAGASPLPVTVAVLPFADGTEDFVERVVYGKERTWNLARKGYSHFIGALPPQLWAKALADDLAASGRFRAARFAYDRSELAGADYYVEGTVQKAYIFGPPPGAWSLALRAYAASERRLVWEGQVSRTWTRWDIDQLHPWLNQTMQEMFAEAGAELARALGGRPPAGAGGPTAGPRPPGGASETAPGSVEETVKRIMEGR